MGCGRIALLGHKEDQITLRPGRKLVSNSEGRTDGPHNDAEPQGTQGRRTKLKVVAVVIIIVIVVLAFFLRFLSRIGVP